MTTKPSITLRLDDDGRRIVLAALRNYRAEVQRAYGLVITTASSTAVDGLFDTIERVGQIIAEIEAE